MKVLIRIAGALLLIIALVAGYGAYQISRTSPCPADAPALGDSPTMLAVRHHCYGPPDSLVFGPVPRPVPGPGELLIKVHAAGVNPMDWHIMRGSPFIMRLGSGLGSPDEPRFGVDFSGVVEAVGPGVSRFQVGERVFGGATGAFAEYLLVREEQAMSHVPEGVSHQQAASVAIAGITALQALRDKGQLKPGQEPTSAGAIPETIDFYHTISCDDDTALAPDGSRLYVGSTDGRLFALGRDGSELWTFATKGIGTGQPGAIHASPAIGADGSIYAGGLWWTHVCMCGISIPIPKAFVQTSTFATRSRSRSTASTFIDSGRPA